MEGAPAALDLLLFGSSEILRFSRRVVLAGEQRLVVHVLAGYSYLPGNRSWKPATKPTRTKPTRTATAATSRRQSNCVGFSSSLLLLGFSPAGAFGGAGCCQRKAPYCMVSHTTRHPTLRIIREYQTNKRKGPTRRRHHARAAAAVRPPLAARLRTGGL